MWIRISRPSRLSPVSSKKRLTNGNMISRDSTGSHQIPVWMVDQHPPQQMFAPGMAADSMSSITDSLTLRIQPAAWTWRSRDINSAGQQSIFRCSDIMEHNSQPLLERCSRKESTWWMCICCSYHDGYILFDYFLNWNWSSIFLCIHLLLLFSIHWHCCSYTVAVIFAVLF